MQRIGVITNWRLALVCAALVAPGCGGADVGRVTGQVERSSGEPLSGANLIARNDATGVSGYATTDAEGKYELSTGEPGAGLPPGDYRVVVLEKQASRDTVTQPTIATKYGDPAQSGLSFTAEAGTETTFNIVVEPY